MQFRPVDGRRTRDDAVIVGRIALGFHQGLSATGRAAREIGTARGRAVEGLGQRLACLGHLMDADVRIVADQLPVEPAIGRQRETAAAAFMSGIGRACREALRGGLIDAVGAAAHEAAAARAEIAAVPARERNADPDRHAVTDRWMRGHGSDAADVAVDDRRLDRCVR
jgi:hypothetical protein